MVQESEKSGRKGRPKEDLIEKYHIKEKLAQIKSLYRNGATEPQIAKKVGCGLTTWKGIKKNYPDLLDCLKIDKEIADLTVEDNLYKRAMGYNVTETHTEVALDAAGNAKPMVIKKVEKHIPGDVTAQIFWLKNRKSQDWKDRHENVMLPGTDIEITYGDVNSTQDNSDESKH